MDTSHFEWKEEYSVKVKLFDEQHQKLIKTVDDLYQSIFNGEGKAALAKIFASLNEYSSVHFADEEKYFQEFDYPEAEMHTALHEKFKKDVVIMETKLANENTSFELFFFFSKNCPNYRKNGSKNCKKSSK